jgi:hypothetical protein
MGKCRIAVRIRQGLLSSNFSRYLDVDQERSKTHNRLRILKEVKDGKHVVVRGW